MGGCEQSQCEEILAVPLIKSPLGIQCKCFNGPVFVGLIYLNGAFLASCVSEYTRAPKYIVVLGVLVLLMYAFKNGWRFACQKCRQETLEEMMKQSTEDSVMKGMPKLGDVGSPREQMLPSIDYEMRKGKNEKGKTTNDQTPLSICFAGLEESIVESDSAASSSKYSQFSENQGKVRKKSGGVQIRRSSTISTMESLGKMAVTQNDVNFGAVAKLTNKNGAADFDPNRETSKPTCIKYLTPQKIADKNRMVSQANADKLLPMSQSTTNMNQMASHTDADWLASQTTPNNWMTSQFTPINWMTSQITADKPWMTPQTTTHAIQTTGMDQMALQTNADTNLMTSQIAVDKNEGTDIPRTSNYVALQTPSMGENRAAAVGCSDDLLKDAKDEVVGGMLNVCHDKSMFSKYEASLRTQDFMLDQTMERTKQQAKKLFNQVFQQKIHLLFATAVFGLILINASPLSCLFDDPCLFMFLLCLFILRHFGIVKLKPSSPYFKIGSGCIAATFCALYQENFSWTFAKIPVAIFVLSRGYKQACKWLQIDYVREDNSNSSSSETELEYHQRAATKIISPSTKVKLWLSKAVAATTTSTATQPMTTNSGGKKDTKAFFDKPIKLFKPVHSSKA